MSFQRAHLTSAKHLPALLNAIQAAKPPPQFNQQFLEFLEFKSPSDRPIIDVLEALGFVSEGGIPTERYHAFVDKTPGVLANGIRDAYPDLFQADCNAQNLTKDELISNFRVLSHGQLSDSTMNEMAVTFKELCQLADLQTVPPPKKQDRDGRGVCEEKIKDDPSRDGKWERILVDGFVYRVQIVSPESHKRTVSSNRGRHRRRRLLVVLTAIFVVVALVGIFATLLRG